MNCEYEAIPDHVSLEIKMILYKCLTMNPKHRPSVF